MGSGLVIVGIGDQHGQHGDKNDPKGDGPALAPVRFPRFHTLRAQKRPHGELQRSNNHGEQTDPCPRCGCGNTSHRQREPEGVFEQYRGTHQGKVARARRAVTLRDQQFLQRHKPRIREEDAHARRCGSGDALADKHDSDERANRDAHEEQAWGPDQQLLQEPGHADVMRIDQHHRHERHVIGGGERHDHQDLGCQPIAAFDRGREERSPRTDSRAGSRGTRPRAGQRLAARGSTR